MNQILDIPHFDVIGEDSFFVRLQAEKWLTKYNGWRSSCEGGVKTIFAFSGSSVLITTGAPVAT